MPMIRPSLRWLLALAVLVAVLKAGLLCGCEPPGGEPGTASPPVETPAQLEPIEAPPR